MPMPPDDSPQVVGFLHNIRSLFNVGSMFRTSDGAGVSHMHLCGFTATPEHPKMNKTALGAEQFVPWSFQRDGIALAEQLKESGVRLWALELEPRATSLYDIGRAEVTANPQTPIALVVSNEITGVIPEIAAHCERVLYIPMAGEKESLNVAVAFGIAVYHLRYGCR